MTTTIGLDLGGTKILGARVSEDGEVLAEQRVPTPDERDALLRALTDLTHDLGDAPAVGVGAAGMVDAEGTVQYAPNIPPLRALPLQAELREELGVPVVVDNDANVAAWAEVCHGAARGCRDVLVITLGTGIGGGIVSDGRLYRGAHGFAAEIGHFQVTDDGPMCACGQPGHWEALASGTALGRMAQEAVAAGRAAAVLSDAGGQADLVKGEHVGHAALAGDSDALEILREYADWVAIGLAGLANVLDPELVVVGGGLVELGDTLFEPVRRSFSERVEAAGVRPELEILPAELGGTAGAIGAAALAREAIGD